MNGKKAKKLRREIGQQKDWGDRRGRIITVVKKLFTGRVFKDGAKEAVDVDRKTFVCVDERRAYQDAKKAMRSR